MGGAVVDGAEEEEAVEVVDTESSALNDTALDAAAVTSVFEGTTLDAAAEGDAILRRLQQESGFGQEVSFKRCS